MKENTNKLFLLRGVPGSGKSTWIKENNFENLTISSDNIRLLYPMAKDANGNDVISQVWDREVWTTLYSLLEKRMMMQQKAIIIDATHNTLKYVKKYEYLCQKYNYEIVLVDFSVDIEIAKERNAKRESWKRVPEFVIDKMFEKLSSSFEEGHKKYAWLGKGDAAEYIKALVVNDDLLLAKKSSEIPFYNAMKGFDQRNSYHYEDLLSHSLSVTRKSLKLFDEYFDNSGLDYVDTDKTKYYLYLAALFHDIGKLFTQVPDRSEDNKEMHYYNHPQVSAEMFKAYVAYCAGLNEIDTEFVTQMILNHDNDTFDKGNDVYNFLISILRLADGECHIQKGNVIDRVDKYKEVLDKKYWKGV